MDIMAKIQNYFELCKEANWNIVEIYQKAPVETTTILGVIVILIIIIAMINSSAKKSNRMNLLNRLDEANNFEEINKLLKEVIEVSKEAHNEFFTRLNDMKESIVQKQLDLLVDLTPANLIQKKNELIKVLKEAGNINNNEISEFFNQKANELEEKLNEYIANLDISNDLEMVEYIEKIEEGCNLFEPLREKFNSTFNNSPALVSFEIIDYLLNNEKEGFDKIVVYNYFTTIIDEQNYKTLFNRYFKDDLDINLALIANNFSLNNKFFLKEYLDELITNSWREDELLEKINSSKNVAKIIGHDESRKVIERVDSLRSEDENKKMLQDALNLAKEAKEIALEAKKIVIKEENDTLDIEQNEEEKIETDDKEKNGDKK